MTTPARARSRVLAGALLWVVIGGWFGALLLFAAVVAPTAFSMLPDPRLTAHMVGRVLASLQLAGMGLGVLLAALGGGLGRGRLAVALPLVLAAMCAANHFGVAPAVAAIDLTDPAAGAGAGARFARLHQLSMGLFLATTAGVLLLGILHAVRELGEEGRKKARIP